MTKINTANYALPERFANMTIHHLYGISEPTTGQTAEAYISANGYGLLADLIVNGIQADDIVKAVVNGKVNVAHWPEKEPLTDFYWATDDQNKTKLSELAEQVIALCGGGEDEPLGGDLITVGAELGSQQIALAGLIYAREQGRLREVPELGRTIGGPIYIVRGSFSEQVVNALIPETTK